MSQNLISLQFGDDGLITIDAALASLETQLAGLLSLLPDQRRSLYKMGDKSEAFCRQTLSVLSQNPEIIPPSLGLAEARQDLIALDQLRSRMIRLKRLLERGEDPAQKQDGRYRR